MNRSGTPSTKPPMEAILARLMSRQLGVFSRAQALAIGVTDRMLHRAVSAVRIERLHTGVYRAAGAPRTWEGAVLAACLLGGEGALGSHRTAAALFKLAGFAPSIVEVSTTRNLRCPDRGVLIHRVTHFPVCDRATVLGIPATDPSRTLLDLTAVAPEEAVEIALDDALRRRLTTIRRLNWRMNHVGTQGKRGAAMLRRFLDARPAGTVIPEGPLEVQFLRVLQRAGLPAPERQFPIRDAHKVIARVDFAYPARRLAIEVDGYTYHSGKVEWERDLARRNAIEA